MGVLAELLSRAEADLAGVTREIARSDHAHGQDAILEATRGELEALIEDLHNRRTSPAVLGAVVMLQAEVENRRRSAAGSGLNTEGIRLAQ